MKPRLCSAGSTVLPTDLSAALFAPAASSATGIMMRRRPPKRCLPERSTLSTASADGIVAFRLSRCAGGIHAERVHKRPGSSRVVQSVVFEDDASFSRWCAADRLQFDYPLMYDQLRRNGSALFHRPP